MQLIDSHCHFDVDRFDSDRATAYNRARAAGVVAQVLPAISAQHWPRLKQVAADFAGLYPCYGLHPVYLRDHRPEHLNELATWLDQESAVAVGECGLDLYVTELDYDSQVHFLTAQLRLARDRDLPVILHARRAVDQITKYIRRFPGLRGVVHSFSGSEQQLNNLLDLGFWIGIGGPLTYERSQRLHRVVRHMPLAGLVLETDAPDQPGSAHRGERNEPAYLTEVLTAVAEIRGEDPATIADVTTNNSRQLFRLPS